jgi:hypothetical protein
MTDNTMTKNKKRQTMMRLNHVKPGLAGVVFFENYD